MNQTEEFDKRLKEAGFSKVERDAIKIISKEAGLKFVPSSLNIGDAVNPHRDTSFSSAVAVDQGKFATRDTINSQIGEIEL